VFCGREVEAKARRYWGALLSRIPAPPGLINTPEAVTPSPGGVRLCPRMLQGHASDTSTRVCPVRARRSDGVTIYFKSQRPVRDKLAFRREEPLSLNVGARARKNVPEKFPATFRTRRIHREDCSTPCAFTAGRSDRNSLTAKRASFCRQEVAAEK